MNENTASHFEVICVQSVEVVSDAFKAYIQRLLEEGFTPTFSMPGYLWFRRHNAQFEAVEAQAQAERLAAAQGEQNVKTMAQFVAMIKDAETRSEADAI